MEKPIIKKTNSNEYLLISNNLWIRNFTKSNFPIDINNLINKEDYPLFLENELRNTKRNIINIDSERFIIKNCVIVSDGYKFKEKMPLLKEISKNATIVGVNGSLAQWDSSIRMDYYVVNNPYKECLYYLPSRYFPPCIASSRTNPDFIFKYQNRRGRVYKYEPTPNNNFKGYGNSSWFVDDYRNPICAAINLAYRFQAEKIFLFCCDELFEDERPGSEKVKDVYMYPQHKISKSLIDGNLYWLSINDNFIAGHNTEKLVYENASYIKDEELFDFFKKEINEF